MSEKSKKRLVGWTQYLRTIQNKSMHYIAGTVYGIGGLLFLTFAGLLFFAFLSAGKDDVGFIILAMSGGAAACGIGAFWIGASMFKNANEIEPVTLITRHNTASLPEAESLVRASDLPLPQQQSELLRVVPQGAETLSEELMRATTSAGPEADERRRG